MSIRAGKSAKGGAHRLLIELCKLPAQHRLPIPPGGGELGGGFGNPQRTFVHYQCTPVPGKAGHRLPALLAGSGQKAHEAGLLSRQAAQH